MRELTNKSNATENDNTEDAPWSEVIADAERQIAQAEARIKRLQGAIRTFQRKRAAREPFPKIRSLNLRAQADPKDEE